MKIKPKIAFISFYKQNKVSPVHQRITDLKKHFYRRRSLYLSLGIPPAWIKDKTVIEFGPGSGQNSIYTASLKPKKYILVEGNPVGLCETKKALNPWNQNTLLFKNKLFLNYKDKKVYDLVLAEACIPYQQNPCKILSHISKFTKKDGLFVCTAVSGISCLSEILRRVIYNFAVNNSNYDYNKKITVLRPFLYPHLKNCIGMTRFFDDWIADNIIHPLQHCKLLSIPHIINVLGNNFEVYSTSPKLTRDLRWYKNINCKFNSEFLHQYYKSNLNLIDNRLEFKNHSSEFGKNLEKFGESAWEAMCNVQTSFSSKNLYIFFDLMLEIKNYIKTESAETALAIQEAVLYLKNGAPKNYHLKHFPYWWGRGQQYISLIKYE